MFLLVLSVTGIVLNHATGWRLNERYVQVPWLLDWYGIEAPAPVASFATRGRRVTLLGERLYLDAREIARGIAAVTGAVSTPRSIVISTSSSVLLVTGSGVLVDRLDTRPRIPGAIEALGILGDTIVFRDADRLYHSDDGLRSIAPWSGAPGAVQWSSPSPVPRAQLEAIQRLYRGEGVTVERLLYDLHSGRLFAALGTWMMDVAGAAFLVLSLTGLALWLKRKP